MPLQPGQERHEDRDRDQDDDDPLQDLHPPRGLLVRQLLVDALQRVELADDVGIPGGQVEALGGEAVDAGEVLIAEEPVLTKLGASAPSGE